jgi:prephenate dehydrogenase
MAIMQAAVHASVLAFALTLEKLPPALRDGRTGTPPFRTMQLLAARMTASPPELYWDIQHENPFAAHARAEVATALADLNSLIMRGDADGFAGLFARVDAALGAEAPLLRHRCAEFFATLSETP